MVPPGGKVGGLAGMSRDKTGATDLGLAETARAGLSPGNGVGVVVAAILASPVVGCEAAIIEDPTAGGVGAEAGAGPSCGGAGRATLALGVGRTGARGGNGALRSLVQRGRDAVAPGSRKHTEKSVDEGG